MAKNKKRVYAAVLLIGALALLLDRVLSSSSPASAQASALTLGSDQAAGDGALLGKDAPAATRLATTAFPRDLPDVGSIAAVRDMFSITDTVRRAMLGANSDDELGLESGGTGKTDRRVKPEQFEKVHRLTGIMLGGEITFAIVDDEWLQVGDQLDGYRLIRIDGNMAWFQCAGGEAALSVADDLLLK
ncbi:MAG: hypothetical protein IID39_04215 [Planctomycetes bacterium]|nr:hypothetical protein [Planctomycetota bacterium]